ncbi:MAG: hypothetical protein QM704_01905 [Anaeromyxobacteraceae bacterium]
MEPYDPTQPVVREKLHLVTDDDAPEVDPAPLRLRIAERVRADSRDRRALTPDAALFALVPELSRSELRALLEEMSREGAYGDIKAVVAPSGRVYLFSERHLIAVEAAELGRLEEARLAVVERIRADSSRITLTAAADLEPLLPYPEPERREAFLAELRADPRFQDIQAVTGPKGETYYHSDRFVSGNYGAIMMRARASDPCWSIAELVRDRSRIMPAPTRLDVFRDPVFQLDADRLGGFVDELLAREGYADVKKLVHPRTRALYLYSDRWLDEGRAREIMDWEEVGALRNP